MKFWFIIMLGIIISVGLCTVQADIRSVPPGGTVFTGEEQLDISAAGISPGSQIAWWAPGTSLEETPADTVTVSNPSSFSVMSSSFSGREGIWYSLAEKTPVMKVKLPRMNLRISDSTSDFDATGKWLPRGHLASFQIETNMYELHNRPGVSGAPVDIIIKSPEEASYSAITSPAGSFSLTGIPVSSALYDTGAVWNTGGIDSGIYSIRAECTANRINLNNAEPGAGVSPVITVQIQDVNPLIKEADKRVKEKRSDMVTRLPTLNADASSPTPSAPPQISVRPAPTVPIDGQGIITDTISPQVREPVQQQSLTSSPAITQVSSRPPTFPPPSPSVTPSTPFPWIIAVIALMYAVIRS
jgi:hypothetical protein